MIERNPTPEFTRSSVVSHEQSSVNKVHPLTGLWLARRSIRAIHINHFKSVMDCADKDQAWSLAYAVGKRFDGDYIEERRCIETWLRREGISRGLPITDNPPLYFRLYPQPVTVPEKSRLFINIPAQAVPVNAVTFTIEDSFHNYAQLNDRPNGDFGIEPRVLTANELAKELAEGTFPEHLDGREPSRYIEAQVWRRDVPVLKLGREVVSRTVMSEGIVTIPLIE